LSYQQQSYLILVMMKDTFLIFKNALYYFKEGFFIQQNSISIFLFKSSMMKELSILLFWWSMN